MAIHPDGALTVDEIVAVNLRALREKAGLTREQLARRVDKKATDSWTKWRILDLEGGRDRARKVLWSDLILLSRALKVTIFELVLPPDDRFAVFEVVPGVFPVQVPRHVFAKWFFGIPGEYLNEASIKNMVDAARRTRSERNELERDPRVIEAIADHRSIFDEAIARGKHDEISASMNAYLAARDQAVKNVRKERDSEEKGAR